MKMEIPPPHGGKIVERIIRDKGKAESAASGCERFEIKSTTNNGMVIRNVYREIMSTCYGFFSPLEGSMTRNEVERILKERRLLNEWLFPFPLMFDISEEDFKALGVKEGDKVLLTLKGGTPFATLDVEEIYRIDSKDIAERTFGTPEKNSEVVKEPFDSKHVGYMIYRSMNPVILAGKYTIINEPVFRESYQRFWLPPLRNREEMKKRSWKTVMVHQTRNVPHIGHEALMKSAAYSGDCGPADGLMVNAIIGAKRPGDYVDEAILEGHESINKAGYIKPEREIVSMTLWDMRYGNPIESLLHGIIRQNLGCARHMFGRDHASMGDYYDPYATQKLWSEGLPSYGIEASPNDVDHGLKIIPQNMSEFWYCPVCNEIAYSGYCNHLKEKEKFSGSFLRGLVLEGVTPPQEIMRKEVYDVVVKWWRKYGYPFVNDKYAKDKGENLEVDLQPMTIERKR